jgi:hypothetical protein
MMDVKHLIGYMIVASISFAWFSAIFWFMYYLAARGVGSNNRHKDRTNTSTFTTINGQYGKRPYSGDLN